MKKILLLLPALLLLALPGVAEARPGQLDQSFGGDGRVITKLPAATATHSYFAWAGGGRVITALGAHLVEYLPNGRLNKRFGSDGRAEIEPPAGSSFATTGLAVDSQRRILVSATVSKVKPGESGEVESSVVAVLRFLPNGRPDPSFGADGISLNDFGFPHPTHAEMPEERGPFVSSSGLLVDGTNRPVVTGSWLSYNPFPCYYLYCYSTSMPFVARLGEDGSLDGTFGSGGVFAGSTRERAFDPVQISKNLLFVAGNVSCVDRCGGTHPVLGRLTADGHLDPSFASNGFADLPFWEDPGTATDRFGRTLLIGYQEGASVLLQRFNSRGLPDGRFGNQGSRWVNMPPGVIQTPRVIAADHRGRPLFADEGSRGKRSYVIVFRRNTRGGQDRGFGDNGQVWTRMPGFTSPTQVLVGSNGRILVGGTLSERNIVLVRYLGDR